MSGAGMAWAQTSIPEGGGRPEEQWKEHNVRGRGPGHPADRLIENQKALEIARRGLEREPASIAWLNALWVSCLAVGEAQEMVGERSDALVSLNEGKAVVERLVEIEPANIRWQEAMAMFWSAIGLASIPDEQGEAALSAFDAELAIRRHLAEAASSDARARTNLMYSLHNLGSAQMKRGRFADAEASYREALAIAEEVGAKGNAHRQGDLSAMYARVGAALLAQGDVQAAREYFDKSLMIAERLVREDQKDIGRLLALGEVQDFLGRTSLRWGNLEQAVQSFRAALATQQRVLALHPQDPAWQMRVSNSLLALGMVLARQGLAEEARDALRRGRGIVVELGASPDWFDEQLSKLN